jgi:hypothetical protein
MFGEIGPVSSWEKGGRKGSKKEKQMENAEAGD